jgi:hypothetical protein
MKSINTPWAISDKYQERYGEIWANLDFVFEDKISKDSFHTDPMNTLIGQLHVYRQKIKMNYKDLLNYSKSVKIMSDESYSMKDKNIMYDVRIKSQNFSLKRHELAKLSETLSEAASSALRAYELGLYL